MSFACIYIPNFIFQAAARSEPELRRQPVAIVEGKTLVVDASSAALKAGVKPGMTAIQAAQMAAIRPRTPVQEQIAHAVVLDLGFSFSPRVEDTGAGTVVLDLVGLENLLGSPEAAAGKMVERSSELGFGAHVAVASNPEAALQAARGFSGITIIPPGQEFSGLGSLPLEILDPSAETLETLHRWGIRTFRALAALSTVQLAERLGQEGVRLQTRARGVALRPLVPTQPAMQFDEVMELDHPIDQLDSLAFVFGLLLNRLCARLKARALALHELLLEMDLDTYPETEQVEVQVAAKYEKKLRLPVPTQNAATLLKLLQLHVGAHPPSGPVVKVRIKAEEAKSRALQGGLFVPASPDPEELEVTLARLAKLVGEENVGSPELLDTHRPDAFRMARFNPFESNRKVKATKEKQGVLAGKERLTALRVFRPPRLADVETRNGLPVRVFFDGIHREVISASGPWRTSGEWWNEEWQLDEWDVEIRVRGSIQQHASDRRTQISLHRICYRNGKWFVTAAYD